MIEFGKFQALGNDFLIVDARRTPFDPSVDQIRLLGHRHLGIGFDQLLVLRHSDLAAARIDIHNADGSVAEQCGNGMRAVALYLHLNQELLDSARLDTLAGPVDVLFETADRISATLPAPEFSPPPSTPLATGQPWKEQRQGIDFELNYIDLGNPHLVVELDCPVSSDLLLAIGTEFSQHPALPEGANVSLARIGDGDSVDLSVFERGVGPTLACGSGACATAVSLIRRQRVGQTVNIDQPGGRLVIDWRGPGERITMTGPARQVFTGRFKSDLLHPLSG